MSCSVVLAGVAGVASTIVTPQVSTSAVRPNVLFVMADDLRPELGAYGCEYMKTPHLDEFGMDPDTFVFDHAYVSVAWCSPSRTAILTSRRPDTSMTWSVSPVEYWRARGGNFTTIPQYFKDSLGYLTLGIGKIFHPGGASGDNDVEYSWSAESLPYDGTGEQCPTARGKVPPSDQARYACLADRCVQLADGSAAGSPDPLCAKACEPLAPTEWLAVQKTSRLINGNMTLEILEGARGTNTGILKKSERLANELPPSMQRSVQKGQQIPLSRPAIILDNTYFLVATMSVDVGDVGCMTPGNNSDIALAQCGAKTLMRLANSTDSGNVSQPFFLAVGLHKPHVPWTVPQVWYDLYPLENITLAPNREPPRGVPPIAMTSILGDAWAADFSDFAMLKANGTVTQQYPYDNSTLDAYWSRRARQAYWAATSFTDTNFGILLQAAKTTGLYDKLIVLFMGDHGFQLGDNDLWSKVSNFEHATRIPLMIRIPGIGGGRRILTFVESLDIFPTLIEVVTASTIPECSPRLNISRSTNLCSDGASMIPMLLNSSLKPNHIAAYSQVPRGNSTWGMPGGNCDKDSTQICESYMGYTVRTAGWRYTEWRTFDRYYGLVHNWSTVPPIAVELYHHPIELQEIHSSHQSSLFEVGISNTTSCSWAYEEENLAADPAFAQQRQKLAQLLCEGQSLDTCS